MDAVLSLLFVGDEVLFEDEVLFGDEVLFEDEVFGDEVLFEDEVFGDEVLFEDEVLFGEFGALLLALLKLFSLIWASEDFSLV